MDAELRLNKRIVNINGAKNRQIDLLPGLRKQSMNQIV